jgi:hypothetical protein
MIYFVGTFSHRYTVAEVTRAVSSARRIPYYLLFARGSLPHGAYIFMDFDRLNTWQIERAAHIAKQLRAAGCQVLNDPVVALQRGALLRKLHRDGINSFKSWSAADHAEVDRFPVFLRTEAAHRGTLSDVITDRLRLEAEIDRLLKAGYPISNLIIIEYRAKPIHDDVFRKLAVYRIGDRMVPAPSVHERKWDAKFGEVGAATEADYVEDLQRIHENPYGDIIRRAFDLAGLEYGRADFGIVDGRVEIYEINSNPKMTGPETYPSKIRTEAVEYVYRSYIDSIKALESESGAQGSPVRIKRTWKNPRRLFRLLTLDQWVP